MLRKIADCMQVAQDVVHPLHPLQSISQIAVGCLSLYQCLLQALLV